MHCCDITVHTYVADVLHARWFWMLEDDRGRVADDVFDPGGSRRTLEQVAAAGDPHLPVEVGE